MAKKEYTFDEVSRDIRMRKFQPVYLLMGEEPYFIDQLMMLLMNGVLTESEKDFNQMVFYGLDTEASKVIDAARRFPMMAEHQLVVIREAQLMRDLEQLVSYVRQPMPSTILVIEHKYKNVDRRKSLASLIEKNGLIFESKKIPDYRMGAYLTDTLKSRGVKADAKASQMLIDYLGNDLSRLSKELDKLAIVMAEKGLPCITAEMVEQYVGISKEFNNFELLRALIRRDVLKSNRIIRYFGANPKKNPIQLTLAVLFNYFSNLLICYYSKDRSASGLAQELSLRSPKMADDYLQGMRVFPAMKVFGLIGEIRQADARSKGVDNASATDEDILKELVYKILH